jgi:hypothetical protein
LNAEYADPPLTAYISASPSSLYADRLLVAYSSRRSTEELASKCAGAYRRTRVKTKAEPPVAAAAKSERSNVSAVYVDYKHRHDGIGGEIV